MNESSVKFVELLRGPLVALGTLHRAKLCLDFLELDKNDVVCDIGCGTGLTTLLLAKRCRRVVGIDISEPSIEFLSNRPHPDNVEFWAIDATLDAPRSLYNKFDKCISMDVMEHAEDPLGLLRFISQILKKRGVGLITFPINNPHHGRNYFTSGSLSLLNLITESDLETHVKILKLDRFGSLLEKHLRQVQDILGHSPMESEEFHGTTCFQMMQKQKKVHSLYKFGLTLLFKIRENPFYEDESGDRVLMVAKKV